jgi:Tfp pilus assembly protein PilX
MRRRLAQESGIALVMALGILIVLSISTMAMLTYTTDNARSVRYQSARVSAYSLAEAGVNEAVAVLNLPTNNALTSTLLPSRTSTYAGGTAVWSGTLDQQNATWRITSTGQVANPSGAAPVRKTLSVNVAISASFSQPVNNQAWNYIYSFKANDGDPNTCEMTINNGGDIATPLYVTGDLCLQQTTTLSQGSHGTTLVVGGQLKLANANQNWVGTSANKVSAAYIANSCVLQNNAAHNPCTSADNVFATTIGTVPPQPVSPPTVEWDGWYNNAAPGPKFPCVPERSSAPSTWPIFESAGSTTRNFSVTAAWNLTPSTAYDCWTNGGEMAWNPTTKVLTVNGTFFIDGSAYIDNGYVNSYTGLATLYLSGVFLLKNSKLCAVVLSNGSGCDTTNWDPNTKSLIIVANADGDPTLNVASPDSVQIKSSYLQGGLYGTHSIQIDTTSSVDGPMIGNVVGLGQSTNSTFPVISFVPSGAPGNPIVYAQPLPPTGYDG